MIAFIPVRGGSKSIPKKNIKDFLGVPLLTRTLEVLEDCSMFTKIVVATDCETIRKVAEASQDERVVVYNREAINATDTASTESVMLEYLEKVEHPKGMHFYLIQVTNPFMEPEDFYKAEELMKNHDSCVTVTPVKSFIWSHKGHPQNYNVFDRPRRQDFEGYLVENGAFYVSTVGDILLTRNRVSGSIGMLKMKKYSFVELDEPEDWTVAEALLNETESLRSGR